jgi:PleD family two-component response regulator
MIATNAHRQISNLAMKDYLTGLMNRTSFDDFMADLASNGKRKDMAWRS